MPDTGQYLAFRARSKFRSKSTSTEGHRQVRIRSKSAIGAPKLGVFAVHHDHLSSQNLGAIATFRTLFRESNLRTENVNFYFSRFSLSAGAMTKSPESLTEPNLSAIFAFLEVTCKVASKEPLYKEFRSLMKFD